MKNNKTLSSIIYYISIIGVGLSGIVVAYLFSMSLLALFGQLPKHFDASIELPVYLNAPNEYYETKALVEGYHDIRIEEAEANLEAIPINRRWPQVIAYFYAGIWVAFFTLVLWHLSKIFNNFKALQPFLKENVIHIRWMGILTVGFTFYNLLIKFTSYHLFHEQFLIQGGSFISPSFEDFDFLTLFLGLIILALSEVFKTGATLQEYENQTV